MFNPQAPGLRDGQERGDQGTTPLTLQQGLASPGAPSPGLPAALTEAPPGAPLGQPLKDGAPGAKLRGGLCWPGERL